MIDNMLGQLGAQVKSEEERVIALESMDTRLTSMTAQSDVKEVVADLGGLTSKAKQEHQALFQELSSAQTEISSLKDKLAALEQDVITDPLTGLLNRRGMEQKLEQVESAEKTSCIIVDIDHFKNINDTYGHLVGDKIIKRMATEIKKHIRGRDLAVRFGGEEFVILLIDTAVEGAKRVAESLRKKVDSLNLVIKANNIQLPSISISLGVAVYDSSTDWSDLFKRADSALYAAKEGGRNQTRVIQDKDYIKVEY